MFGGTSVYGNGAGFDAHVQALSQMDYYVNEDVANIIFDVRPNQTLNENLTLRATLTHNGTQTVVDGPLTEAGFNQLQLPLADLAAGTYSLSLDILDQGSVVWQGTDTLVKQPPPPAGTTITQIDRYRRVMHVDGNPFFPMGVMGVFAGQAQTMADAGFNVTQRWKSETTANRYNRSLSPDDPYNVAAVRDYLDAIHASGMYAFENPVKLAEQALYVRFNDVEGRYTNGPYWDDKYPVINEQVVPGVVQNAMDHPAVIGYYSYDEPDNFWQNNPEHKHHLMMQKGVEEFYEKVKSIDPYHPVAVLFSVGLSKNMHWDAWDIPMRDFYVGDNQHMSSVYENARAAVQIASEHDQPFVYTPLFDNSSGRSRPLSPEEHQAQAYLSLAADVNGIFYWDFAAAYLPSWEMLDQTASEVEALAPILLDRSPDQSVAYLNPGTENSVKVLIKNHNGKTYLIAANAESAYVDLEFTLPERYHGMGNVWFEDDTVSVQNGTFSATLQPYGRGVYELDGQWNHNEVLSMLVNVGEFIIPEDPTFEVTRNLIRNGHFAKDYGRLPGWPAEWGDADSLMEVGVAGHADGRWTPVTDEAVIGNRSMRLTNAAGDTRNIYTNAWAPAVSQGFSFVEAGDHTLSLYLKAEGGSRVWILVGWDELFQFDVTDEWERYEFLLEDIDPGGSFLRVYMMDKGTLWVDGVQMELGRYATEYIPEPTTAAIIGLGSFALLLRRRRCQRES
ncbi:PEP-CTERM sorting domain-containing protein [Phycisphaerales bacterium AB-hyl4]|uniref:PEP-CTERM sorting domain-containing protein n=1 Tax=Natronomicrosphaera hydrolytica TaxID=3242702 RepID=A0ABV4U4Z8_9BACT